MLRGSSAGAGVFCVLAMMGCSDPASPPPRGAATIVLSSVTPPVTGKSCPSQGDPIVLGAGDSGPSQSSKGSLMTDDEGSYKVKCDIGSGAEVKFSGTLGKGGSFFQIAGAVAKGGTGKAMVSVYDPASTDRLNSTDDALCDVNVADAPFSVGEDSIWASFTCPKLVANEPGASRPEVLCDTDQSFIYFEQCN